MRLAIGAGVGRRTLELIGVGVNLCLIGAGVDLRWCGSTLVWCATTRPVCGRQTGARSEE